MKTSSFYQLLYAWCQAILPSSLKLPGNSGVLSVVLIGIFLNMPFSEIKATASEPCANCSSWNHTIGTTGTDTNLGVVSLSGCVRFSGTIVITDPTTFNNLSIRMASGAKIRVEAPLTILDSYISGCGSLWEGIHVTPGEVIDVRRNVIKDAEYGLLLGNFSTLRCEYNVFRENYIGISVGTPTNPHTSDIIIYQNGAIIGNTFTSFSSLPTPYSGHPDFPSWSTDASIPYDMTYAGIFISGSNLIRIGVRNPGAIGDWNTFQSVRNGVMVFNAAVEIAGSRFSEFEGETIISEVTTDINQQGVYASHSILRVMNCDFSDVRGGVAASNSEVICVGNDMVLSNRLFRGLPTGIFVTNPVACTLRVNEIENPMIGIRVEGSFGELLIQDNIVDIEGIRFGEVGIILTRCTGPLGDFADILSNYVTVEEGNTTFGIRATFCSGLSIEDNTVQYLGLDDDVVESSGFVMDQVLFSEIERNFVYGTVDYDGDNNTGYRLVNSIEDVLFCNYSNLLEFGHNHAGVCFETELVANDIDDHAIGLQLVAPAYFVTQAHNGNRWIGNYNIGAFILAENDQDAMITALSSDFVVDPNDAVSGILDPAYGPISVDGIWFNPIPNGGDTRTCETIINITSDDEEYEDLLHEILDFETYNNEMEWMEKYYLYLILFKNPALLTNAVLDSFFTAEDNQPIGELAKSYAKLNQNFFAWIEENLSRKQFIDSVIFEVHQVDSALMLHPVDSASLYADRIALIDIVTDSINDWQFDVAESLVNMEDLWVQVKNDLTFITPTNLHEDNLVASLDLQLSEWLGTSPSSGERDDLLQIASQCIWQGGPGIFLAQLLYSDIQDTTFSPNPLPCQELDFRSIESASDPGFIISPNPGQSVFEVVSSTGCEDNTLYIVTDFTGRVYAKGILEKNRTSFDMSTSSPGIYLLHLYAAGKTNPIQTLRFVKV